MFVSEKVLKKSTRFFEMAALVFYELMGIILTRKIVPMVSPNEIDRNGAWTLIIFKVQMTSAKRHNMAFTNTLKTWNWFILLDLIFEIRLPIDNFIAPFSISMTQWRAYLKSQQKHLNRV